MRPHGLRGFAPADLVNCSASRRAGWSVEFSNRLSGAPSCATRAGSVAPKTVRRMISSVIACIERWTANDCPTGQRATWRSATAAIVSP
ncbi:MAG TPA: hypothetical protein VFF79_18135 [Conexibacter sp.]|jgi:hypothetical protein|nr:hypothetical protein [Conexibacter sp.]